MTDRPRRYSSPTTSRRTSGSSRRCWCRAATKSSRRATAGRRSRSHESAKPDLVLLDVVMPELDGFEVCRQLRAREDTAVLPVIMLTASEGTEKTKAIDAGADDFIPKPFNHDELLARVRSLLRIKRYHDEISGAEPHARRARGDPAPGARPHAAAPAVPLTAARRGDRLLGRRVDPRQSPPSSGDGLRRPPRLDELRRLRWSRKS